MRPGSPRSDLGARTAGWPDEPARGSGREGTHRPDDADELAGSLARHQQECPSRHEAAPRLRRVEPYCRATRTRAPARVLAHQEGGLHVRLLSLLGPRPLSDAIARAMEKDGGVSTNGTTTSLRMVQSSGRYSSRKVTYFRVFDPAIATQRSLDVRTFRDLDDVEGLIVRSGACRGRWCGHLDQGRHRSARRLADTVAGRSHQAYGRRAHRRPRRIWSLRLQS